jgi:hypothetical protein
MGEWRQAEIGYLKVNRTHCDLCGQLIPGRYWVTEIEGADRAFCTLEHEEKYVSYWIPRYGPAGASARPSPS